MKPKIALYLAGSIKKEHEKLDAFYWTEEEISILKDALSDYELSLLNPALRTDDLSDQHSVFGRDMLQVFCSDAVFVDARDRRGLGVGAEMMWAKCNRIPVITLAPKNSHYHKVQTTLLGVAVKNWVHPFVESLSDQIVDSLEEGARWLVRAIIDKSEKIKGIDHIESAMHYYNQANFEKDQPMQELFKANEKLKMRFNQLAKAS